MADSGGPANSQEAVESYDVVVNDEDQYSIWRTDRERPAGWRTEGSVTQRRSASGTYRRSGPTCAQGHYGEP